MHALKRGICLRSGHITALSPKLFLLGLGSPETPLRFSMKFSGSNFFLKFFLALGIILSSSACHQGAAPSDLPNKEEKIPLPDPGNGPPPPVQSPSPPVLFLTLQATGTFNSVTSQFDVNGLVTDQNNQGFGGAEVMIRNSRTQENDQTVSQNNGQFEGSVAAEVGDTVLVKARDPSTGVESNEVELLVVFGTTDGQLSRPEKLASYDTNEKHYLFVTDHSGQRIQVFETRNEQLIFVTQFGKYGENAEDFNHIRKMTIRGDGTVFLIDEKKVKVLKFKDECLRYITQFNEEDFVGPDDINRNLWIDERWAAPRQLESWRQKLRWGLQSLVFVFQ